MISCFLQDLCVNVCVLVCHWVMLVCVCVYVYVPSLFLVI